MNTYLISSETNYYSMKKIEELKNNISNIIIFNMDVNTIDEVLEEASYLSMFNDEKCIIVKNANFFASKNKETEKDKVILEKITKYLDNENPQTKLIFTVNGSVDARKKLCTLFKNNGTLFVYSNAKKTDIKNELNNIVIENGYKIDSNSLWHIVNSTNGNLDLAIKELEKIMLYYSEKTTIKYYDVINLVSKSYEDNAFKIVDAITEQNYPETIKYINNIRALKIEPNVILSLLFREYKLMHNVIMLEKERCSHNELLKQLGLQEWQYDKLKQKLMLYKSIAIKKQLVLLADLDYKLKSGKIDRDLVLIEYVMESAI